MTSRPIILIAESKPFLAEVIRESFGNAYYCYLVQTEEEVYGLLQEADAAVISLDVCAGEQNQRKEMIRKIKESYSIPVMAITSLPYSSVRIELLQIGADDVMTKPFNPDELVVRVEKMIAVSRR